MKTISKIKSILLLAILIFFVSGCNKGKDPAPILCYLLKSTSTSSSDPGFTGSNTFNYSTDMKLTTVVSSYTDNGATETETYTVTYDSKGNITKAQNSSTPISRIEFTYDANNHITRKDYYEDNVLEDRTDHDYNASGQLIKDQYYEIVSGTAKKDFYSTYEYANTTTKNPLKLKYYSSDGTLSDTSEYLYDDKKTPFATLGALFNDTSAENNVTKETNSYQGSPSVSITTYTYEYNDNGYPTKSTSSNKTGTFTSTDVNTYTYDCK